MTNQLVRMTKTQAPVQNLDPDYSASGKLLVFSRVNSVATHVLPAALYWMRSIPNSPAVQLTKPLAGIGDRGAAWSPDGRHIAFYSDRAGNNDLYMVDFDRRRRREATHPADVHEGRRSRALMVAERRFARLPE